MRAGGSCKKQSRIRRKTGKVLNIYIKIYTANQLRWQDQYIPLANLPLVPFPEH